MCEPPNENWWIESKFLYDQTAQTCIYENTYVVGSKSFRPDIQKPRQMENAVRDI